MLINNYSLDFYYPLFSSCFQHVGFSRTLLVDTNRKRVHYIPNSLSEILNLSKKKTLNEILIHFSREEQEIIWEYIEFLVQNEFVTPMTKEDLKRFPPMSLKWDYPTLCSNAIIDVVNEDAFSIFDSIKKLVQINCFHIQVRFFTTINTVRFEEIISFLNQSNIYTFDICTNKITDDLLFYKKCIELNWKFSKLEIYNWEKDFIGVTDAVNSQIYFYKRILSSPTQCGIVDPKYFSHEIESITESLHFNSCLNRKLCIDHNGYVKNCPSMSQHFGHITDCNLEEVIQSPEFQKLWFINKDQIDVCQDCEFRYICPDCRCFIQDENDIYSQPMKCTYNPYICKWEGEEGYISVSEWRTQNPKWNKRKRRKKVEK